MGQERPVIGDDGELLDRFSKLTSQTTEPARLIDDNNSRLVELQRERQAKFLILMREWENKQPEGGLAKEFVTVGKGDDRAVFYTNPLLEEGNVFKAVYVALSKHGFFTQHFGLLNNTIHSDVGMQVKKYISSPFQENQVVSMSPITSDKASGQILRDLHMFHSYLRSDPPGKDVKFAVSYEYGALTLNSLKSRIGRTTYGPSCFDYYADSLGAKEAYHIIEHIQDRVKSQCEEKASQISQSVERLSDDLGIINTMLPDKEKRKRFWHKK